MAADPFYFPRLQMVDQQILHRGVVDPSVLQAMRAVPRHKFVPPTYQNFSYADQALPIGQSQTISQPYIVALMAEGALLKPSDTVLEIGTGCGYSAAVLSKISRTVHTIETIEELYHSAKARLQALRYQNVFCHFGDGSVGLPEHAPYDAIVVTAGAPYVPQSLKDQLAIGGRLVIPVSSSVFGEKLLRISKVNSNEYVEENLGLVAFVPLVGKDGYSA